MQVARSTSLPRATAGRLLASLLDEGLVESPAAGRWVLGYELTRLGKAADTHTRVRELARPALAELSHQSSESAMLGVMTGHRSEVILQIDPPRLITPTNWVGRPLGLHASAGGKLLLASLRPAELGDWLTGRELPRYTSRTITDPDALAGELRRVRRRGYAETIDELEEGLSGIAVPVPDSEPALALAVSGPSARLGVSQRAAAVAAAQATASRLRQALTIS